jgi:sterol desaturase/sphingolipid hydroxylase (fatty acid hydroxylase superfamily)
MPINILGFAIPLFVGLILLEYFITKKKGLHYFNLHSSIANVSIGIAERLADVFVAGIFYYIYNTIQIKYGLFHISSNVFVWIALFLATDFIWYWYHRFGHEINLFWMAHIVHHQSEDYNLTVSARITVLQAIFRHGFWLVLPFIGFPAGMITVMLLIHGLYPFFVHTRLVGNLGILEYVFVTPSHHRVHHASNEKYLDKNYGDVLIIWDKLFGTFVKEEEEPVYGLTKPLNTYSFLWQHFHYFIELWLAVKSAKGFKQKLQIVFGNPEKLDPSLRQQAEDIFEIKQSRVEIDKPLNKYVVWQMIILLFSLFVFILFERYFSVNIKIAFTLLTLLTLINCGAIMEQKRWVFYMEYIRMAVILYLPFYSTSYWQIKIVVILFITTFIISYYRTLQKNYYRYVLK